MDRKYGRMLEWSLAPPRADARRRRASTVASAVVLYPYVGKELVPDDDQSEFSVNLRLPRGTSFERTLEYMTPIEGELRQALGTNLESMMTSIQNGSGNYSVQLTPLDQRKLSQQQLMQVARRTLSKYRNARISVSGGTDISGASTRRRRPRRRRRRGRRQQPADDDRAGPGHRRAAEVCEHAARRR